MDENIKEKLQNSIYTAFDKWGAQYYQRLLDQKSGNNWEEEQKEAHLLNLFLTKRVFIYGFYRHVTEQVLTNSVSQRHRKTLLKAGLLSIIDPDGVTAKDLEKIGDSEKGYTYTHTRRFLLDDYPETFIRSEQKRKDERFTPFQTVFSPFDLSTEFNKRLIMQIINKNKLLVTHPKQMECLISNARIRTVTPEYLEDLITFQQETLEILREIKIDSDIKGILQTEMKSLTDISTVFHAHFQSIMAVEWWRNRQKITQRKLIDDGFPFKFTSKDAILANSLLSSLTDSLEHQFKVMFYSALAFDERELPGKAALLFNECLKLDILTPIYQGILHENIAVMLRKQSKPKLTVQEMKKALEYYRESGDSYRTCVAIKNLGEAEWNLGYKDTGLRYFSDAETLCDSLEQSERSLVLWNLANAARRINEKSMECEYLLKCMTNCTEDQTRLALECDKRLSELMC